MGYLSVTGMGQNLRHREPRLCEQADSTVSRPLLRFQCGYHRLRTKLSSVAKRFAALSSVAATVPNGTSGFRATSKLTRSYRRTKVPRNKDRLGDDGLLIAGRASQGCKPQVGAFPYRGLR